MTSSSRIEQRKRPSAARQVAVAAAAGVVAISSLVANTVTASATSHLNGKVTLVPFGPSPAKGLGRPIGAAPTTTLSVSVVLKANSKGEAPASEAATVSSWLRQSHIKARRSVLSFDFRATTNTVGKLLKVSFSDYHSGASTVYAASRPWVPSDVAPDLEAILGLNDAPVITPSVGTYPLPPGRHLSSTTPNGGISEQGSVTACAAATDAANAWADTSTPAYTLDQVGDHYGVNTLLADGDEGSGVTIALVELAASSPSDVDTYDSCFGLDSSNYSVVDVDGGGTVGGDGTLEADLDIEQLQTQAPLAHIISYEAPSDDYYDDLSAIVTADTAQVISISWGGCESAVGSLEGSLDQLLTRAAQQNQSVFVAAGDNGSEDCAASLGETSTLAVDVPAEDDNVTAVGGTSFDGSGDIVWNNCASSTSSSCTSDGGGASGGGIATYSTKPEWQDDVNAASGRAVPDISAFAEGNIVYEGGNWENVYGTSAAAPLVAGMVADVIPSCSTAIGNLAPRLYAYESADGYGTALTDVTSGNNDWTDAFGHADYQAGAGYDLASGLGTPIATGLLCPTVASVSASSGAPGSSVTISGSNLTNATVAFGSTAATITSHSATSMTVTVPNGAGTEDINVSNPIGGASGGTYAFSYNPVSFTSGDTATFTAGQSGSFTITTTGYSSPTLSVANQMPDGLTFTENGNGTGVIAGTPSDTAGGVYTLDITAEDASGSTTQEFTLTVDAPPVYEPQFTYTYTVGQDTGYPVSFSGYPTPTVSVTGLPSGLSYSDGDIEGTPAAGASGTYSALATATNSLGTTQQGLTITVNAGPVFTSPADITFISGQANTSEVTTTGTTGSSITIDSGTDTLPGTLSFVDNGNGTGTISGTPTTYGTYYIGLSVSNGVGQPGYQYFAVTVDSRPSLTSNSGSGATLSLGTGATYDFSVSGSPVPTLSESGPVPSGMAFASGYDSGTISGAPEQSGTFSVTISATNAAGTTSLVFTILVPAPTPPPATTTTTTTAPPAPPPSPTPTPAPTSSPSPPSPSPTPKPATPSVSLRSATSSVTGSDAPFSVACLKAECSGTVTLTGVKTVSKTETKKEGKKEVKVVVRVSGPTTFGSEHYTAAANKTVTVKVALNAAGRDALADAKTHRVSVTQTVTVTKGTTVKRTTTLVLVPVISLRTAAVRVLSGTATLTLACSAETCSGKVSLGSYGSASYKLAAGKSGAIRVKLTAAGRSALSKAKNHLSVTQSATVVGGATERRTTLLQ